MAIASSCRPAAESASARNWRASTSAGSIVTARPSSASAVARSSRTFEATTPFAMCVTADSGASSRAFAASASARASVVAPEPE